MPVIDETKLAAVFDIEDPCGSEVPKVPEIISSEVVPNKIFDKNDRVSSESLENALDNSIEYVLTTQSNLINKANRLVDYAVENANGGTARDIETASETINAAVNATEKLIDIQKKIKELKSEVEKPDTTVQYQQNNIQVFGSTNEVIKKIRDLQ